MPQDAGRIQHVNHRCRLIGDVQAVVADRKSGRLRRAFAGWGRGGRRDLTAGAGQISGQRFARRPPARRPAVARRPRCRTAGTCPAPPAVEPARRAPLGGPSPAARRPACGGLPCQRRFADQRGTPGTWGSPFRVQQRISVGVRRHGALRRRVAGRASRSRIGRNRLDHDRELAGRFVEPARGPARQIALRLALCWRAQAAGRQREDSVASQRRPSRRRLRRRRASWRSRQVARPRVESRSQACWDRRRPRARPKRR